MTIENIYAWCNVGQYSICLGCKSSAEFYKGMQNVPQCFPFLDQRFRFRAGNPDVWWGIIDIIIGCMGSSKSAKFCIQGKPPMFHVALSHFV